MFIYLSQQFFWLIPQMKSHKSWVYNPYKFCQVYKKMSFYIRMKKILVVNPKKVGRISQWAKTIISTQINSNHHKFIVMPCIVVRLNIRECCSTIKMYQSLSKLIKMNQKLLKYFSFTSINNVSHSGRVV